MLHFTQIRGLRYVGKSLAKTKAMFLRIIKKYNTNIRRSLQKIRVRVNGFKHHFSKNKIREVHIHFIIINQYHFPHIIYYYQQYCQKS